MNEADRIPAPLLANNLNEQVSPEFAVGPVELVPDQLTPDQLWQWISSNEPFWRRLFYILLIAPLMMSGPLPGSKYPLNVCWPRIHSGDEPHYLLILNSLIQDGDLDLSNNYAAVHTGSAAAGRSFAGWALDHHVSWYHNGEIVYWWMVFNNNPMKWARDSNDIPVPTRQRSQLQMPVPAREYPTHPPGLAFLLAIPAYFFRGTVAVESIALACTALSVVLASYFFEKLIAPYTNGWQQRLFITGITFLGSPIWHYGRTLFVEPYLMCLAVAAYACALRSNRYFWAGVCIAIGIWMKPPFAVLALPLGLVCLMERRYAALLRLSGPILLSVLGILAANHAMHGSVLASTIAWESGNPIRGSWGLIFSPTHGIILFSPIAILSIMFIPQFFTRHLKEFAIFGSAFLLYFCPMALFVTWHGGYCFGPRMIIPVLPFLYIPLCCVFGSPLIKSSWGFKTVGLLVISSLVFNGIGAFGCGWVWNRHPAVIFAEMVSSPN